MSEPTLCSLDPDDPMCASHPDLPCWADGCEHHGPDIRSLSRRDPRRAHAEGAADERKRIRDAVLALNAVPTTGDAITASFWRGIEAMREDTLAIIDAEPQP